MKRGGAYLTALTPRELAQLRIWEEEMDELKARLSILQEKRYRFVSRGAMRVVHARKKASK